MKSVCKSLLCTAALLPMAARAQTLDQAFTITYDIERRDIRSKQLIQSDLAEEEARYAAAVKDGSMAREQVTDILNNLKLNALMPTVTRERMTLSYNGSVLLVRRIPLEDKKVDAKNAKVVLASKAGAFTRIGRDSSQFLPFISIQGLEHVPFVGPSLPFLPLRKGKDVLSMVAWSQDSLVYGPGSIKSEPVDGAEKVTRITLHGGSGRVVDAYDFLSHERLGKHWIGKSIRYTTYNFGKDPKFHGQPRDLTEYRLVSATAEALPEAAFQMQNYLSDGEAINITKSPGRQVVIAYDHRKGDLANQVREAELAQRIAASRVQRSSAAAAPAGIVTALLLVGAALRYRNGTRSPRGVEREP